MLFNFAEQFDDACDGDEDQKAVYRNIILTYIEYSYIGETSAVPIRGIWSSIGNDNATEFRKYLSNKNQLWITLTIRKTPTTIEFADPMQDMRVKKLGTMKWKPVHLCIYYGRQQMIEDIIKEAGKSLRKAISIESK